MRAGANMPPRLAAVVLPVTLLGLAIAIATTVALASSRSTRSRSRA